MFSDRLALYEQLERKRNSKLIVYITSDKPGMETQVANDSTEYFVDHLDKIGIVPKISLLLHTNGGYTSAGWNIVNLIRQFCEDFEVIVPSKARSTGTLMCLGANRIIMTKQATLGPIDPSVNTPLNPQIPNADPNARVPVSVEAIKGFLDLAKHELDIHDDNALASVFSVLAEKVHPLALGEVYRAISQIQMLAKKLLQKQVNDPEKVQKIISFLCSESGSHDYTINRREARDELGLVIEKPDQEQYNLINAIYRDIKVEMEFGTLFDPKMRLNGGQQATYCIKRCLIESIEGNTDAFVSEGTLSRVSNQPPMMPIPNVPQLPQMPPMFPAQMAISDQRTFEGWRHYNA